MSLVAYDSSDDSDSNETDVQETPALCKHKEPEPTAGVECETVPESEAAPVTVTVSNPAIASRPQQSQTVATEPDSDKQQSIRSESEAVSTSTLDPHISDEEDDFMLQPSTVTDKQELTFGLRLPAPKTNDRRQQNTKKAGGAENSSLLLGAWDIFQH